MAQPNPKSDAFKRGQKKYLAHTKAILIRVEESEYAEILAKKGNRTWKECLFEGLGK